MNAYDLALLVRQMRRMQNAYFANKTSANLDNAQWAERKVDAAVKDAIKAGQTTPPLPFDAADHVEGNADWKRPLPLDAAEGGAR